MRIHHWNKPAIKVNDQVRKQVEALLADPEFSAIIPAVKHETWIEWGGLISPGTSLVDAHRTWTAAGIQKTRAAKSQWDKRHDAECPPGLSLLGICCANEMSGGMSSHFGFEGYFLSVLVNLDEGRVWDARGEPAR